jgi:hypothetical protein
VSERGAEVVDHAELGEDDLAVGELEDVAAGGVHPLAGGRDDPGGLVQRPEVGALQRELDDIRRPSASQPR